jgi:hypothetical protein
MIKADNLEVEERQKTPLTLTCTITLPRVNQRYYLSYLPLLRRGVVRS